MAALIMILVSAMFFPGIILRTKSIASGRRGPGILQPLRDAGVLLRKGSVFSTTTGLIFQIAPVISLATVLCAILVIPFGKQEALIHFEGDFVFFAYILSLGRFFMIIAALDTGSSFEGMGASREAFFAMLIEPAFFILMATFAMFTGYVSFTDIFSNFFITSNHYVLIFSIIGFYIFIQIALVENSRLPVDDPKTHLELTMIHEVMILDYSGFDKALIHITTWLKFAVYGSLIYNVVVPAGWNIYLQIALFLAVQALFAIIVGFLESFRARNKMNKNPKFILTVSAIAILAFAVILILNLNL
ncbi:MAG TPA: NADH-quinone oxidoreductase subunit H [Bacteroidales bacterium]|jgi:formate hydrogenlyase subunit 4|nr:formate hydrogenlyase [Bacteroidales bacterium]NLK55631.1 formate hydrogenlyase [Bacteroidales bacterium]HNY51861.1 NADH-quinone oxidoreductase subunit H [Bacteroidales bacterium]HOG56000.1 NADH-quinone oxidoreductase subunit H [Bacteroidales bacterium]HPX43043.1 NADH-quinone oxidoreductase subunit H [Bacteroidales bacterium]